MGKQPSLETQIRTLKREVKEARQGGALAVKRASDLAHGWLREAETWKKAYEILAKAVGEKVRSREESAKRRSEIL